MMNLPKTNAFMPHCAVGHYSQHNHYNDLNAARSCSSETLTTVVARSLMA